MAVPCPHSTLWPLSRTALSFITPTTKVRSSKPARRRQTGASSRVTMWFTEYLHPHRRRKRSGSNPSSKSPHPCAHMIGPYFVREKTHCLPPTSSGRTLRAGQGQFHDRDNFNLHRLWESDTCLFYLCLPSPQWGNSGELVTTYSHPVARQQIHPGDPAPNWADRSATTENTKLWLQVNLEASKRTFGEIKTHFMEMRNLPALFHIPLAVLCFYLF